MELITAVEAGTVVTTVVGYVTENIPAILVLVGAFVGLKIGARLINGGAKGKVRV